MSQPIIEQIAQQVVAVVNSVTQANGYRQDLTAVRPKRNDWADVAPTDGMCLVWQEDDEPLDSPAINTMEFAQVFNIVCVVLDSDTATTSIDMRLNAVKSDLRKAFLANSTLSGLAIDVIPAGAEKFDDGDGFTGIQVRFIVRYRTSYIDPYTQI